MNSSTSRKLHIVLPMGGRGERFVKAGITTPKPLIPVDGMPMFAKALSSFKALNVPIKYTFIVKQDHIDQHQIDQELKKHFPQANIVSLTTQTTGPLETVMAAQEYFNSDEPLIVLDCDLYIRSKSFEQAITAICNPQAGVVTPDGMLVYFTSDLPRYSYLKLNQDGFVSETAEKIVISNNAIAGAYFFSRTDTFLKAADKLKAQPLGPNLKEHYISLTYNYLIADGAKITAHPLDEYASFGTPEELKGFESSR